MVFLSMLHSESWCRSSHERFEDRPQGWCKPEQCGAYIRETAWKSPCAHVKWNDYKWSIVDQVNAGTLSLEDARLKYRGIDSHPALATVQSLA